MNYSPNPRCLAIATKAANGKLTEREILDAFERINAHRASLSAEGKLTGQEERLRRFAAEQAEKTRIAAAAKQRQAAINVLKRRELKEHAHKLMDAGMAPHRALQAINEGAGGKFAGVAGGRRSVWADKMSYRASYLGSFFKSLEEERPHLIGLLTDRRLDEDTLTEMWELRDGGKPGVTGNADAQWLAKTFADLAEFVRTEMNQLGASIGKLDGWNGVQTHDSHKLLRAGKEAWIGRIVPLLDVERTFSEGVTATEATRVLGGIFDTIITGLPDREVPEKVGQRVNPANLADSLGKMRVLHFKDAAAALTYRDEFGFGNTIAGMTRHFQRMGDMAGLLHSMGPNPPAMFESLVRDLADEVRANPDLTDAQKAKWTDRLDTQKGALRSSFQIVSGLANVSENLTWSDIGSGIRSLQRMAKLVGATLTSVPSDAVTAGLSGQFRGSGFYRSISRQIGGMLRGRPKGEQRIIGALLFHGYDGLIGRIMRGAAEDGPRGVLAKMEDKFFRVVALTQTTDIARSVAGRTMAAEMGMYAHLGYDELNPRYRHVLGMHDITAAKWDVMRQSALRQSDGNLYLTPDRLAELSDQQVAPLIDPRRLAKAAGNPERLGALAQEARRNLQIDLLRFHADEMNSSVISTDAATQRWTTWGGQRSGSLGGELARYVMQFKGFPIAFTQRVGARALFGQRKDASWVERGWHIGTMLSMLTVAGYMAGVGKDIRDGYWPPRNPADWRVLMAAFLQGGVLGVYGDYLFAKTNRFSQPALETVVGPTIGSLADLADVAMDARDFAFSGGEDNFSGARAFSTVTGNVPFLNLWYTKPAVDWLFLNSMREALSPGYMRRQEQNRFRDYRQSKWLSMSALQ